MVVPVAHAASASNHPHLQRYFGSIIAPMASYRSLLRRLDSVLSEKPMVNVDPKVEKLYTVADRFDGIAARWEALQAPTGLKLRHRGMGRALELQAQGWRIYAAGLFTRRDQDLHAALVKLGAMLRSAAYLQKRWAAALRGALIRAESDVPNWLDQMASSP
jgi:hypothetical protein